MANTFIFVEAYSMANAIPQRERGPRSASAATARSRRVTGFRRGTALGPFDGHAANARASADRRYFELPCPRDAVHEMPAAVAGILEALATL